MNHIPGSKTGGAVRTRHLALAMVVLLPLLAAAKPPTARWSFGLVELKETGDAGTQLYGSLKNLGATSDETVLLYALAATAVAPASSDKPIQDLSTLTRKVKTCVLQTTLTLPEPLAAASSSNYKLVLTVAGMVTDSLPIKDGKAAPPAPAPPASAPSPAKGTGPRSGK